jgi:hypothetical protein
MNEAAMQKVREVRRRNSVTGEETERREQGRTIRVAAENHNSC